MSSHAPPPIPSAPAADQTEDILRVLPTAVFRIDNDGRIAFYNDAAAALWGRRVDLGARDFWDAWPLYRPDGSQLPHAERPTMIAWREKRAVRGMEALAERRDGKRIPLLAYSTPILDGRQPAGVVTMLLEVATLRQTARELQHYAAIVESSEDAIISKDLNGVIVSWNEGAQRLFGYTAEEAVGRSITLLIPPERLNEEPEILARIRRGERIEHYETVRMRRDGGLLDISLTVSPIKDSEGKIVGASKIARDVTERKRDQAQRDLLLRETNHRIKNLLAISGSVVSLSARSAQTPAELAASVTQRLAALARAHSLMLASASSDPAVAERPATLHALIRTILSPYEDASGGSARTAIVGPDIPLADAAVTGLALLLHEFATNAAKYGALSSHAGTIEVVCAEEGDDFRITWMEHGGPPIARAEETEGFGSLLVRAAVQGQLGGAMSREWNSGAF